ncbi:DUF4252 domain-containing protein [Winogradskyella luteola]|uniref:DUF4252 domain-containing protein n=1 Tax=Winogradskyella luteola TaxID=2828330 RepID=A0A9X1JLS0_9FLAO|nr:DUF4252 domain-containing protein [Winogradskyella luteola]MBV7267640.1 DUF4252 domain-containing protein [Winogradskyella luteola]
MLQSIKKSIVVLFLVAAFTSCNQGPTLQTYYVNNQEKNGFISIDAPTSLLNVESVDMTDEQREAYESVDKLNILAFKLSEDNTEEYKLELKKVKGILNDVKYEELMRGSTKEGKFVVKFLGESETSIDELIVFGSSSDKGFAIVRVLGDNMNAGELMKLSDIIESSNVDEGQLGLLKEFF